MKYIIYLIYNNTTDTYYIGQTNNWIRRALEHHLPIPKYKRTSTRYYKQPRLFDNHNTSIIDSINQHHKITYTWLSICNTQTEANKAEVYWIQTFKNNNKQLYNKTCGGAYDKRWDVQFVDIAHYPKPPQLPLNQVESILKDPYLLRQDRQYTGLELVIRNVLLEQTHYI